MFSLCPVCGNVYCIEFGKRSCDFLSSTNTTYGQEVFRIFSENFGTFILKETQDIHPKMKKKDIY